MSPWERRSAYPQAVGGNTCPPTHGRRQCPTFPGGEGKAWSGLRGGRRGEAAVFAPPGEKASPSEKDQMRGSPWWCVGAVEHIAGRVLAPPGERTKVRGSPGEALSGGSSCYAEQCTETLAGLLSERLRS